MHPVLAFLQSIYPLPGEALAFLTIHMKERALRKKEFLLRAGHTCQHVYFVQSGLLRCFYQKEDVEVSSWFMQEGDLITSVLSFYYQQTSYESIQALEDCQLAYIHHSDLQRAYREFPELNFVGRVLTEKYYAQSEERLQALRLQRAPQKFRQLQQQHPQWLVRVPAVHLASYLGITKVWLSRIRTQVNREKTIPSL